MNYTNMGAGSVYAGGAGAMSLANTGANDLSYLMITASVLLVAFGISLLFVATRRNCRDKSVAYAGINVPRRLFSRR